MELFNNVPMLRYVPSYEQTVWLIPGPDRRDEALEDVHVVVGGLHWGVTLGGTLWANSQWPDR